MDATHKVDGIYSGTPGVTRAGVSEVAEIEAEIDPTAIAAESHGSGGAVPIHNYHGSGQKPPKEGRTVAPGVVISTEKEPDNDIDLFPGLRDEALVEAIRFQARNRKKVDYKTARRIVMTVIDRHQGELETIYTGRKHSKPGVPKVNGPNGINTEHIWPQSKRGPKSDVYNMKASDTEVNSRRSSHPFGWVEKVHYEEGGSRIGEDKDGKTVMEARPASRGNVARLMFYVATVYPLDIPPKEEAVLRQWNDEDPVDAKEAAYHERAAAWQGNRNPFIDDDDLVDRISDL